MFSRWKIWWPSRYWMCTSKEKFSNEDMLWHPFGWLPTSNPPLELSRFLVSSSLGRLRCPRTKSSDIIVLQIIWAFLRFTSPSGIRVWGVWRLPAVRSWAFPFPGFIRAPSQHPFVYRVTASWCLGRVALLLQAANVSVQPNCAAFRDLLMSCFHANLLTTTLGKSKCMTSVSRLSSGHPDFYSTALFNRLYLHVITI